MNFRRLKTVFGAALLAVLATGTVQARSWQDQRSTPPVITVSPAPATNVVVRKVVTNAVSVSRSGVYYDRENVARYIRAFGTLPSNFITKQEARRLGWQGGPLEPYAPGKAIGGDYFGNYERKLPFGRYRECDIDTKGRPRGAKRIIYSDDRRIYFTGDHYRTFQKIP